MPKKQKVKPESNIVTSLVLLHRVNRRGGKNRRGSETRRKFLFMYERTGGNVSASCHYAGISRMTFYRWQESKSPENVRFQKHLAAIKPQEVLLDIAEGVIMQHLEKGSLHAAEFVLDRKGGARGWNERKAEEKKLTQDVQHLIKLIQNAAERSGWSFEEELKWFFENVADTYKPELITKLKSEFEN